MSQIVDCVPTQSFIFPENQAAIRQFTRGDGEECFIGIDVCNSLDLKNSRQVLSRLEEDERGDVQIVDGIGRPQSATYVTLPGLFSLIGSSRQERTKIFKRWVNHEVLPSIRKTGKYDVNQPRPEVQKLIDQDPVTATLNQLIAVRRDYFDLLCKQQEMGNQIADATMVANDARTIAQQAIDQVNGRTGFMAILGYAITRGYKIPADRLAVVGKKVAQAARARQLEGKTVHDERFGTVKSWPVPLLESLDDVFAAEHRPNGFKVVS